MIAVVLISQKNTHPRTAELKPPQSFPHLQLLSWDKGVINQYIDLNLQLLSWDKGVINQYIDLNLQLLSWDKGVINQYIDLNLQLLSWDKGVINQYTYSYCPKTRV
jgi:hypothetical protein